MKTIIDAQRGEPYRIDVHERRVRLTRTSSNGRVHTIVFTADDAASVTNALVDAAEQLDRNN